ncbi:hypothetical protein [Herbidospora yilanensis]|uniref:hypothetical protein n=1 Tax=Herbidospora yilanensis TaxID=354426 RepID=UPI003F6E47ED
MMVLITVRLPRGATLDMALRELRLKKEEVDVAYGVVAIDPDHGLYGLRVSAMAAHRLTATPEAMDGPWADPKIEPMGPPRKDR